LTTIISNIVIFGCQSLLQIDITNWRHLLMSRALHVNAASPLRPRHLNVSLRYFM